MLAQAIPLSASFYLFDKDAKEIYEEMYTEDQVNDNLNILMRINTAYLSLTENDGFPFIDPAAFNNQCHIYAYMASKIKLNYKEKTIQEKLDYNEENRFLHLSFILSYTFLTDRTLLMKSIQSLLLKGEVVIPEEDKKSFYSFIKDHGGLLVRTARTALNRLFETKIKELLEIKREQNPLFNELYQISLENLYLPSGRNQTELYTLPKIVGVAYLIEEKIAFVIKTKVISSRGSTQLPLYSSRFLEKDDTPVLIFEAVASEEYSIGEFRRIAEKCPLYFERKPSSKHRHREDELCQFCTQAIDIDRPHLGYFKNATEVIEETLFALGADFTVNLQPNFIKHLTDTEKYPLLSQIFKKAIDNIETLGVSMEKPLGFTIDHVYVDDAKHALSQEFRMNLSPQAYLETRGLI